MAIRPTDTSLAIVTAAQNQPFQQRTEEGPRLNQQIAQQQFIDQTAQRSEQIAESSEAHGNRIGVKDQPDQGEPRGGGKRRKRADGSFDEVVEEAAGLDEPPHLIDFTA